MAEQWEILSKEEEILAGIRVNLAETERWLRGHRDFLTEAGVELKVNKEVFENMKEKIQRQKQRYCESSRLYCMEFKICD